MARFAFALSVANTLLFYHIPQNSQKTVKSTAELEVELNATYAFDAITEAGANLEPRSGPGLQGLVNLGNSCYMNSIVQLLASLQEVRSRYASPVATNKDGNSKLLPPDQAMLDLTTQFSKVISALTSGVFACPLSETDSDTNPKYRISPNLFKHVIGKDHIEFRTSHQQDAAQFLQYLLEQLDRAEAKTAQDEVPTSHWMSFGLTERLLCTADQGVKYKEQPAETVWSLRIPMDKAVPIEKEPDPKRQKQEDDDCTKKDEDDLVSKIALTTCIQEWAQPTTVDDMRWSHLNSTALTQVTSRFRSFPKYLVLQIQRYELGPDWQPKKLQVELDVDSTLDLSSWKSTGPQEGENLVPDEPEATAAATAPAIDEAAVSQLQDMGFSRNACIRALTAVGGGSNVEAAMNWVFEHNTDPDFNDPLPESGETATSSGGFDEAVVESLVASLGCFTSDQVRAALKETGGAADRAADWLFSHMDDLNSAIAAVNDKNATGSSANSSKLPLDDGPGQYTLMGMVSHIGKHTGSGHYVAHILKDNEWIIFNDEKVAKSAEPPIPHAYLYLYQRTDTLSG